MKFMRPIARLPIQFCGETLAQEVLNLPKAAWVEHPDGFPGNNAVRLISPEGKPSDAFSGTMAPTEYLESCPYIMELMAELGGTWGRSRLMGLAPGASVPAHIDSHYYWRTHLRIHIPAITNPGVEFTCGGETVHMKPGECWTFDSFQRHEVHNRGAEHRTHLVLDTVGGGKLWEMVDRAQNDPSAEPRAFNPGDGSGSPLLFERVNSPKVMSPWELRCHIAFLTAEAQPHPFLPAVLRRLDRFADDWAALWSAYADSSDGVPLFKQLMLGLSNELVQLRAPEIPLKNDLPFLHVFARLVFEVAISRELRPRPTASERDVASRPRLAS